MKPICFQCGYSLGDLDAQERCPECGADAEFARRTLVQRFAHPERLGRCRIAAQFASCSMLSALILGPFVALDIAAFLFAFRGDDALMRIALAACAVVWLLAWVVIARLDPTAPHAATVVRAANSGLLALSGGAAVVMAVIILNIALPRTLPFEFRNAAHDIAPPLLSAQMFLVGGFSSRIIALCYRRPKRVWPAILLRAFALLLLSTTLLTAAVRIGGRAVGQFRSNRPVGLEDILEVATTLTSLLAPVTVILALWSTNCLFVALRHASRRYKAHLSELRAGVAPAGSTP